MKKKRKNAMSSRSASKPPIKHKTREEINKMRIPGVPYLPPPPDPNLFKKGDLFKMSIYEDLCKYSKLFFRSV